MDELIILEIEGRANSQQIQELRRWREASEEHERRYEEIRALWFLSKPAVEDEEAGPVPSAREVLGPALWRERVKPSSRRRWLWAAAAAALILISAGSMGDVLLPGSGEGEPSLFRSGPNELVTAVLEDGTVARLAPGTTLRTHMNEDVREAELEGRAFFAVSRDEDRPFRVTTSEGTARVLGTRFELDTRRSGLRLLVVDGRVAVGQDHEVELGAGELAHLRSDAPVQVTAVEAPEELLDWMGAWVAFESTPLQRVAAELEVRLGVEIEIVDDSVADRTLTGWFAEEDRDEMLLMVCRVADVRCERVNDHVRIEG